MEVFDRFDLKTMKFYYKLYLKHDVFMLADMLAKLRNICLKIADVAWVII